MIDDPSVKQLIPDAQNAVKTLLSFVGENPEREGLLDTPKRVVKAWYEMLGGYRIDPKEIFTTFEGEGYDEMVLLKDIEFRSFCEHHMLPFLGTAHVAYIPGERIVGLSKPARVVDIFSQRLQVQERLTKEIADCVGERLNPKGVAVVVEAHHQCMSCRGVKKQNTTMVTSKLVGDFREQVVRDEFFSLIKG